MPSDATIILQAKATLAQACIQSGVQPSEDALYWLLGLVYGESRFGQTADWTLPNSDNTEATNPGAPAGPSHNWGAVRASGSAPFIWHGDRNADGSKGMFKFARFSSQLDGAKFFLNVINRGAAKAVIGGQGTARDLAAAMYANHYYTGVAGSDNDRINAYANMILSGANRVRKVVGAGPASAAPSPALAPEALLPGPTFVPGTSPPFPWASAAILAAVGVGGTLFLAHHNPYGLAGRIVHGVTAGTHHTITGVTRRFA